MIEDVEPIDFLAKAMASQEERWEHLRENGYLMTYLDLLDYIEKIKLERDVINTMKEISKIERMEIKRILTRNDWKISGGYDDDYDWQDY